MNLGGCCLKKRKNLKKNTVLFLIGRNAIEASLEIC